MRGVVVTLLRSEGREIRVIRVASVVGVGRL
jgi:hypothetical protein